MVVGYQPEEMAIVNGKLYVANSGGYRVPLYDNRIMVIDLATFNVIKEIEVDVNLHRLLADSHGQLWVSTRGNYFDVAPALYCLKDDKIVARLEIPISSMTIVGDSLYYIGTTFSYVDGGYKKDFGIVDVALQRCSVAGSRLLHFGCQELRFERRTTPFRCRRPFPLASFDGGYPFARSVPGKQIKDNISYTYYNYYSHYKNQIE